MATVIAPDRRQAERDTHGERPSGAGGLFAAVATVTAIAIGVALVVAGVIGQQPDLAVITASTVSATGAGESGVVVATGEPTTLTDVSTIAARVVESVVTVNVTIDVRGPGELTGSGSGVVIDSDGTVVTNAHVVTSATSVAVTLADGTTLDATVVGIDVTHDLALLRVDASGLSPVEIGSTSDLSVGDPVIAVGNPLGLEGGPSVTTGIVSALGRVLDDGQVSLDGVIQTDAAITEGSSGGALLDSEGRLIGVTTAVGVSSVGVEGIGFAIPIETVTAVVAALVAT